MIFVDRTKVPEPGLLKSDQVWRRVFEDAFYYSEPLEKRRQERREFDRGIVNHPTVTKSLFRLFHGKCAYCERVISHESFAIDQYRPPRAALHDSKKYSEDHYWWLAYDWTNLNLSCLSCRDAKGSKFPIKGEPAPIFADADELAREQRYLVNPCLDYPEKHFFYSQFGEIGGLTPAGKATVAALDLNRPDLLDARRRQRRALAPALSAFGAFLTNATDDIETLFATPHELSPATLRSWRSRGASDAHVDQLETALLPQSSFVGMVRDFIANRGLSVPAPARRRLLRRKLQRPDLQESLAESAFRREIGTKRIEAVTLKNFRTISYLQLDLARADGDRAPWLMLLGENAAGKTSILQAIALTLMGDKKRRSLRLTAKSFLRKGASEGYVRVRLSGSRSGTAIKATTQVGATDVTLTFSGRKVVCSHAHPQVFLLGYGSMRLVRYRTDRGQAESGHVRARNLFDHSSPLIDTDRWLLRQRPERFDYAARALKDVLRLRPRERLVRRKAAPTPGVELRLFDKQVNVESLSDGYQSVLGLTIDIIRAIDADIGFETAEGIVLLDEIGAHLHPRWRMLVVSSFRRAFPRLQFVTSTHDPLCLRGLENGEVVVLRRNRRHRVFSVEPLPPIRGMTSEQLLTSEYFGLFSTVEPDVEKAFNTYYRLLSKRRRTSVENRELRNLRHELERLQVLGQTQRERILLRIIDKFLALEPNDPLGPAEHHLDGIVKRELGSLLPATRSARR